MEPGNPPPGGPAFRSHGAPSRGDIDFGELVDRHAQELFRLAYSMLGNTADAEDVLQETLLAAYRGLTTFEARSSLRTWLTAILVRQVARRRRYAARRPRPLSGDEADAHLNTNPQSSLSQTRDDLAAVLAGLTPEHRDVLVLRELRSMSYEEIALMLGVPRGTIESRLHRARQALRELLSERREAT